MDDGIERRALLLHLGEVLESMSCVARCATRFNTIGEALTQDDAMAAFWFLETLDPGDTPEEYCKKSASAFFLWPKLLLGEELNQALIASLVQTDLFPGNQAGWDVYASQMQKEVPWFGLGAGPVVASDKESVPWPPIN